MKVRPKDEILHDHNHDGIDRRGFLKCMAWAGTGAFCVIQKKKGKKSRRKSVPISGIAMAVLFGFLALCARPIDVMAHPAQNAPTAEVKIDNFSFGPAELKVAPGTTVMWINRDDIPHTVVSTDGVFKSKVLDTDDKFSFTFSKAGTYPYYCSIHPKMTGRVIVQ